MEYIWCTILNRDNFFEVTPRTFFGQYEAHVRLNSPQDKKEEYISSNKSERG